MDSIKIYDSGLSNRDHKSLHHLLDRKLKSKSSESISLSTVDNESARSEKQTTNLLPDYRFVFGDAQIGEHVEYNVVLLEKYKILGRSIVKQYEFRTRYSKLEVLDKKLGEMGLPGKKFFGNKDPSFVEKRKVELQTYLNKVARSKKPEFYRFVQQIKDCQFNLSLKQGFSIE